MHILVFFPGLPYLMSSSSSEYDASDDDECEEEESDEDSVRCTQVPALPQTAAAPPPPRGNSLFISTLREMINAVTSPPEQALLLLDIQRMLNEFLR